MKEVLKVLGIVFTGLLLFSCSTNMGVSEKKREQFIDSLIQEMTLDEKIGQMTQICISTITLNGNKQLFLSDSLLKEAIIKYHIGSFISGTGSMKQWNNFVRALQETAITKTRLGIPLLIGIDHIHGANYLDEGSMLPHAISLSCSFDTNMVRLAAAITAEETMPMGTSWNFAPVLDVARSPYWPRFYETFGEDPLLCSQMGAAYIREYQKFSSENISLSATAKHFVGYSGSNSGFDRTPSEISDQSMEAVYLPPFQAAVEAGVRSVMLNSGEVNGEPVHISEKIISGLLRKRLGFEGVIVTDIKDILKVVEMHAAAPNEKEATFLALSAGVDISMVCNSFSFYSIVKELLEEGRISEKRIDESVKRILRMKYDMNLFSHPYPPETYDTSMFVRNRKHAEELAEESMVLLKNEELLPLKKDTRILLAGPAAHSRKMLNGAWTFEWIGAEENMQPSTMKSLYEAMQEEFGEKNIDWVPWTNNLNEMSGELKRKSSNTDVIVLALGEMPYSEFRGNDASLELEGMQEELALLAVQTAKPCVLLLVEGRPRLITHIEPHMKAIVFAGLPGSGGGRALASILSGQKNPCGKTSFSYPSTPGNCIPYMHKKSESYQPLYPFGHGLSYTRFEYTGIELSDTVFSREDTIHVEINLANTGEKAGSEISLWYLQGELIGSTRPVKQLIRIDKNYLEAGENKTIRFHLNPEQHLSYPDARGEYTQLHGTYTLIIGEQEVGFKIR